LRVRIDLAWLGEERLRVAFVRQARVDEISRTPSSDVLRMTVTEVAVLRRTHR
jgi:hypothetical protein